MQYKRHNRIVTVFGIAVAVIFNYNCSKNETASTEDNSNSSAGTLIDSSYTSGTPEGSTETGTNLDDLVENSSFTTTVSIVFGTTTTFTNPLEGNGVTVTQSGNNIVITSTSKAVAYSLSGTTANGSLKIYSDNKFKLTLNGVNITNTTGPAINIQSSKRAFVVLVEGTTNTLTDGTTYTAAANGEDQKGTFFSEGQLLFSGSGSLAVRGNSKHAICSDDYVRIQSGTITVSAAATDGIHTNDGFYFDGGTLSVNASSDGIEAEEGNIIVNAGNITINAVDDGIAASYTGSDTDIDPFVTINGGTINIKTNGGEGIESKSVLTINGGHIVTNTVDDGLNASSAIYINGGRIYAYSTGNDAMDSNGTFTITGGTVVAVGARAPEASFDCDARTFKVTGGNIIGIAGATSGPTTSVSTVDAVVMGSGSGNQLIHIEAADGSAEALTFLAPTSYSTLLYASSKLKSGTSYKIYTGGSVTSGTDFNGLYTGGTYVPGTAGSTFTTTNILTQIGGSISRN